MSEAYIPGADRRQRMLLPECVEDYVAENCLARVIDVFVEGMPRGDTLACLPPERVMDFKGGRRGYCPKVLAKLFIWGYLNKVRSTRGLEREATRNLELIWLLGALRPDHASISRFRADNRKRIVRWIIQFNLVCSKLGLIGGGEIAIDSVRLKAVNSKRNSHTQDQLKERIAKLQAKAKEYEQSLASSEASEKDGQKPAASSVDLKTKLQNLQEARTAAEAMLEAAEESPTGQLCTVDGDARILARRNSAALVGYLAQSVVDSKNDLIVAVQVTTESSDLGQLAPMAQAARELTGRTPAPALEGEATTGDAAQKSDGAQLTQPPPMRVLGDCGYFQINDLVECEKQGWEPYVAIPHKGHAKTKGLHPQSSFHYEASGDFYRCPEGKELARHDDYIKDGATYQTYYNTAACRQCPARALCTKGRYRKIHRHAAQDTVDRMHARMKANPEVYKRRGATVEHPFGSMMFWNESRNLLCRGKEKANTEFSLSALAYNIKRAVTVVGMKALLEELRRFWCSSGRSKRRQTPTWRFLAGRLPIRTGNSLRRRFSGPLPQFTG